MRRAMAAVLLLVTACGSTPEQVCTAIGVPVGVGVDVRSAGVATGALEVCWDGRCTTRPLALWPSSRVVGGTCAGTAPEDVCSASAEPDGGLHGYADVPDLPVRPVVVKLRLADGTGATVLDRQVEATPKLVRPGGPECGGGGAQLNLAVAADGSVTAT
ncbi:hypothetical protein [Saccharothrix obliqua]|uniref:hypothetical protein n=1 Tax=Saccharothrix obliqua TaxID=2861747 RepID=UPI001C5F6E6D|nr:hypothetical protein [Saccharothrix obliqua]MBW4717482.1 hypothetical protein [Saccharothrix obliqua]